ncbi:unnamed protein product [Cyprideis torosa]|uniref:Uncharacterized protein n=1 Tax=Cyprideis torosa TaxID=163714 RepID=A0A7R8WHA0_9CRUS|nr:unnamed protein product [Cyprideis torosa]CAG0892651.1 unnamed protein product [Cyprideis torosa]
MDPDYPCSSVSACSAANKLARFALEVLVSVVRYGLLVWSSFWKLIFRAAASVQPPKAVLPPIRDEILLMSLQDISSKLKAREISCVEVMQCFINRTKVINPFLNALVDERFEDALRDAEVVDQRIQTAADTGSIEDLFANYPLLGLPLSNKDSIAVKGLRQTVGLHLRKDVIAEDHARVVQRLVDAGAIPLCVTTVPEVCMHWECTNSIHGRTNNPYDIRRTSGGSSGGEGAFQTACGSSISIGSDIGGSIRIPAFFNGIFGLKPSAGIISNQGQYPPLSGERGKLLVLGPLCRHAKDLSMILPHIVEDLEVKKNLSSRNPESDLQTLRVFYMTNDTGNPLTTPVSGDCSRALRKVIQHFKSRGIPVRKVNLKRLFHSCGIWMSTMFPQGGNEQDYTFLQELGNRGAAHINPYLELLKLCIGKGKYTLSSLVVAIFESLGTSLIKCTSFQRTLQEMGQQLRLEFDQLLGANGIFLYPTWTRTAPFHNESIAGPFDFGYTCIFNALHLPAVTCPMGLDSQGLPVGVQAVANFKQDHHLLTIAEEIERAFGGWVCPSSIEIETHDADIETHDADIETHDADTLRHTMRTH